MLRVRQRLRRGLDWKERRIDCVGRGGEGGEGEEKEEEERDGWSKNFGGGKRREERGGVVITIHGM